MAVYYPYIDNFIRDLFHGVTAGGKSISKMNIESMGDGSFLVHLICKDAYDVKLQLPPGWHRHEFEIGGNDNCTIRCCKICGKTSMLLPSRHQWHNIAEGE